MTGICHPCGLAYDHRMKALDLAGIGMQCLAIVAVGSYVGVKYKDWVRKEWDEKAAVRSGSEIGIEEWNPDVINGHDEDTDPESFLQTWGSRFKDPYTDMFMRWEERISGKSGFLGWARLITFWLALLVVLAPWIVLRMLFLSVAFLIDRENDFRLRIIALTFGVGLCLELAGAAVS